MFVRLTACRFVRAVVCLPVVWSFARSSVRLLFFLFACVSACTCVRLFVCLSAFRSFVRVFVCALLCMFVCACLSVRSFVSLLVCFSV